MKKKLTSTLEAPVQCRLPKFIGDRQLKLLTQTIRASSQTGQTVLSERQHVMGLAARRPMYLRIFESTLLAPGTMLSGWPIQDGGTEAWINPRLPSWFSQVRLIVRGLEADTYESQTSRLLVQAKGRNKDGTLAQRLLVAVAFEPTDVRIPDEKSAARPLCCGSRAVYLL